MAALPPNNSRVALTAKPTEGRKDDESVDVIVIGAGRRGLTLACELLRRNVICRVLERLPAVGTMSRAFGIQPRSLEVLDVMGVTSARAFSRRRPIALGCI